MKKKEIKEFANKFKELTKVKYKSPLETDQSIVDFALDYECGSYDGNEVETMNKDFFIKGLSIVIADEILSRTKHKVGWDFMSKSPIVNLGYALVNIKHDVVNSFNEGRCAYDVGTFMNMIFMDEESCSETKYEEVGFEAPLPLSAPGDNGGNYSQDVDYFIERKLEFLEDVVRTHYYGEGSCRILSIEEMTEIGNKNEINIEDSFWQLKNPDLDNLLSGVIDWYVGWLLYVEDGFSLKFCTYDYDSIPKTIIITDGYSDFNIINLFNHFLQTHCDNNPFLVVEKIYQHMIKYRDFNRDIAWHNATPIN